MQWAECEKIIFSLAGPRESGPWLFLKQKFSQTVCICQLRWLCAERQLTHVDILELTAFH